MQELKDLDEGTFAWFSNKPPKEWSRSHFSTHPRCDILLNNACECFNSNILEAREKPILSMLECLMEYLIKRLQQNKDRAKKKWKKILCPKIQKIIDKNIEKLGDCIPIKSGLSTCNLPNYGRNEWKKIDFNPPFPPKAVKRVGRPPKARRLEVDEVVPKKRKGRPGPIMREGSSTIKRQQTIVKCGKCGAQGHNARGCQSKNAITVPDASNQEPEMHHEVQLQIRTRSVWPVRRKGKGIKVQPEMQRRTRSGHIPVPDTVMRKPPKPGQTTPTIATMPEMSKDQGTYSICRARERAFRLNPINS
ncbi:UNVERIFIED_CONTAM: hypothetical protein Sradi_6555000 [Sesamum radiatum]|uniref:CCHC-type domain-containing protein n=1 Tax=Sesamum radiatum TaxID=300843 RepID=A0AAW2JWE4_SESRA